eukprot:tig00000718_g3679.t1
MGYVRTLNMGDLYPLWEGDQSHVVIENFQREWNKEKHLAQPSFLRAMRRAFGTRFFLAAPVKLVHDVLQYMNPILLHALLSFVAQHGSKQAGSGFAIAFGMLLVPLLQILLIHQYFHMVFRTGMHIRAGLVGAIYKKALTLSNSARQGASVGQIVTLMSADAQRLMDLTTYLHIIWSGPFQIILSIALLYQIVSWAAFSGLAVMVLMMPINTVIAKKIAGMRKECVKATDERVKVSNEVFQGIKIIKLYAWERPFIEKLTGVRGKELDQIGRMVYAQAASTFVSQFGPILVSLVTFGTYALAGNKLTAAAAFTTLQLFNLLRFPLMMLPNIVNGLAQSKVAINRMSEFLLKDEVDLDYIEAIPRVPESGLEKQELVRFRKACFSWDVAEADKGKAIALKDHKAAAAAAPAPAPPPKMHLKDVSFSVRQGDLVMVVGPVGSGKTSLLSAIIGEMRHCAGEVAMLSPASLRVAYVAQESWISNATLRDNVCFGLPYERAAYERTVAACALVADFSVLPAGDLTEIGEKGINLSGGQKARVALARAVYSDSALYLLDDPLSAVDSHVAKHIFEECVQGVLGAKTRVLCTHHLQYLPHADLVLVLKDGQVAEAGTYRELVSSGLDFAALLKSYGYHDDEEQAAAAPAADGVGKEGEGAAAAKPGAKGEQGAANGTPAKAGAPGEAAKPAGTPQAAGPPGGPGKGGAANGAGAGAEKGRLIKAEARAKGGVDAKVYKAYILACGGTAAIAMLLVLWTLSNIFRVGSDYWLAYWSAHETGHRVAPAGSQRGSSFYLSGYALFGLAVSIGILARSLQLTFACLRGARVLHDRMFQTVLRAPMSFFETTPLGRITNRFSADQDKIDQSISGSMSMYINTVFTVASSLMVIIVVSPWFILPMVPLAFLYRGIQRYYIASSRELKRLDSVSRSPIYAHFSETLSGLATVRAFKVQQRFEAENERRLDESQRAYYCLNASNRWLGSRLEFVGASIVFLASLLIVVGRDAIDPGIAGLSMTNASTVTGWLSWMVRVSTEVEMQMNAVERALEYCELAPEAPAVMEESRPPRGWPARGAIEFEKLVVKYRHEPVLKGLSASIRHGEKIGIVGRTGAGKSTLMTALFRLVEPAGGAIRVDGVDITAIGTEDLRSKLSIIPQDPVLFSGSLRSNLDPFSLHSDPELWSVVDRIGMRRLVEEHEKKLEYPISEGGSNLSAGQKQLVCLGRCLLRKSKILVLDEATSSVDQATDAAIQATVREEFKDATVLAIAHRLNTILDADRVLVLDQGQVAEFDSPRALAAIEGGIFASMLAQSGNAAARRLAMLSTASASSSSLGRQSPIGLPGGPRAPSPATPFLGAPAAALAPAGTATGPRGASAVPEI